MFSITKIFPLKFPGIFANIFQRKIIPVYDSQWSTEWRILKLQIFFTFDNDPKNTKSY